MSAPVPVGASAQPVETTHEMRDAVRAAVAQADVLIMAAAASDFRPAVVATGKIKKRGAPAPVALEQNDDILVATKVEFDSDLAMQQLADEINGLEAAIREHTPAARLLFIEPDVYRA